MSKRYIIALILSLITVLIFLVFRSGDDDVHFKLAQVERGTLVTNVSASGKARLKQMVNVLTPFAGEALKVDATFNDPVQAGQVLAELDPSSLQTRLAQVQANLKIAQGAATIAQAEVHSAALQVETAEAQLESARAAVKQATLLASDAAREMQIVQKLSQSGDTPRMEAERKRSSHAIAISSLQLEKSRETAAKVALEAAKVNAAVAEANSANAQTTVEARDAELREVMAQLDQASLRSPITGVVIDREIEPLHMMPAGAIAFTVAPSLTNIEILARADEADIGRVAKGQTVRSTFDALPDEPFMGRVEDIRKIPQNVQGVVTYEIVISVDTQDARLLPGMTAETVIEVARRDNVIKVPRAALRFNPAAFGIDTGHNTAANADHDQGSQVWVLEGGDHLKPVSFRAGISNFVHVEMLEGDLTPGQDVIVGATQSKSNGGISSLRF